MPFDQAFDLLLLHEGGFTANPRDPGNWTGGAVGQGECRGTKWGISAGSYPTLAIQALTPADARAIYRRDYWDPLRAGSLPPPLALLAFDAAVNAGVGRAARWLQGAAGTAPDGAIGPKTLAAVAAADPVDLCVELHARRLLHTASLPTWETFGPGWSRRLCRLPFQAMGMGA